MDETSKDPKIVLEKIYDGLKNYKTKKPLEGLALVGKSVEFFWQHGDKDIREFEYGKPLVPKHDHLKLPWIVHVYQRTYVESERRTGWSNKLLDIFKLVILLWVYKVVNMK
jgi:hypothetical protein